MKVFRQTRKLITIFSYMGFYGINSVAATAFTRDPWEKRKIRAKVISKWCKRALKVLGVKTNVYGHANFKKESYLIVSNHLSYLDILVLASFNPTCFVTSVEIKNTPLLGWLTDLGGCLYVERRNKSNIHNEIKDITLGLEQGLNVTVFPEATSTNGESVLRFRRPLYNAAIFSENPVLPMCLSYKSIDGAPFTIKNRDQICWYGKAAFLPHLWTLLGAKNITAQLDILPKVEVTEKDDAQGLAESTHRQVSYHYEPVKPLAYSGNEETSCLQM